MDPAEQHEASPRNNTAQKQQPAGAETIRGKADQRGCNPPFDAPDGGGQRGGGIAPPELIY
jgi:hypothetical protein